MNVRCIACGTVYRVDPHRVPTEGVSARCTTCSEVIEVRPGAAETAPRVEAAPERSRPTTTPTPASQSPRRAPMRPAGRPRIGRPAFGPAATRTRTPPAAPTPTPKAVPVSSQPIEVLPPPEVPALEPAAPAGPTLVPQEAAPLTPPAAPPEVADRPVAPVFRPAPGTPLTAPPVPPTPAVTPTEPAPSPSKQPAPVNPFLARDPQQKARRLARALVSDMIVYQPEKRQQALAAGNLKEAFDEEIKKSWEEYVEQVGPELANSTDFFKEALNEILAGGQQLF